MSIIRQLVSLSKEFHQNLDGKTEMDRYEVEQWFSFVNTTLIPAVHRRRTGGFEANVMDVGYPWRRLPDESRFL
jgi:hypothetical protein